VRFVSQCLFPYEEPFTNFSASQDIKDIRMTPEISRVTEETRRHSNPTGLTWKRLKGGIYGLNERSERSAKGYHTQ
jgi:hypothetical protein